MGNLLFSVNGPDLVQCLDGGRQATMHAEDLKDIGRKVLDQMMKQK